MLYFGIDVSRDKLDCAIVDEQGQRVKRARTFANDTIGLSELTLPLNCVVLNPTITRPFCAVPRASVVQTALD